MELNAETRSVNEIFSPNKKYFVPRFQREYSWKEEEVDEFWEDIVQQIRVSASNKISNEEYFIGCIVLVGEDSKPDYLIVDGQQRLTTLTILLRTIVQRLSDLGDKPAAKALYHNVIEGTDNDGLPYFKLVNESPKPFFQNELQSITPQGINLPGTEEELLLQATYFSLQKKIKLLKIGKLNDLEAVKTLREQVLNYLKFILVTAKSEDDAYTIFETLNARGLSLTSVDLIKNWIFKNYDLVHPNDNAKDIWSELRKQVSGFSDLEVFFRHYWNSKYSFASDDRLYKSFKDQLKAGRVSGARDFLVELRNAASLYRLIGAPVEDDWPVQKQRTIYRSLVLLNQYKVTQVRPFLLALLECHNKKSITQTLLIKTVENLENFHFIFSNVCQDRASGLEGKYTRAAKNLHLAGPNKVNSKKVITDLCSYLEKKRPTSQRITDSLRSLEFKSGVDINKKTIQTIFSKIERRKLGTSEHLVGSFSLEHIDDQSNKAAWVGGIGNLLPLDEELNNLIKSGLTFKAKKKQYGKSNMKVVAEFILRNPQDTWDKTRAEDWLDFLSAALADATQLKAV